MAILFKLLICIEEQEYSTFRIVREVGRIAPMAIWREEEIKELSFPQWVEETEA